MKWKELSDKGKQTWRDRPKEKEVKMATANITPVVISSILRAILSKPSVDVPKAKSEKVADQITTAINQKDSGIAVVQTQSPVKSKTNWLNSGVLAAVLGYFGINIPTTTQEWVAFAFGTVVPLANIVIRSWFTKTVTPASVK